MYCYLRGPIWGNGALSKQAHATPTSSVQHIHAQLLVQKVNVGSAVLAAGHIECRHFNLSVSENHARLDLPTFGLRLVGLRGRELEAEGAALGDATVGDVLRVTFLAAVDVDDARILTCSYWCVTAQH